MNDNIAKTVIERFIATWNAKDAEAFSLCFRQDGDFVNILGQKAAGRNGIAEMHRFPFAVVQAKSVTSTERLEIRELDERFVAADFWWKVVGSRTPKGDLLPDRYGLIYFVIEIENGEGLIISGRNTGFTSSYDVNQANRQITRRKA